MRDDEREDLLRRVRNAALTGAGVTGGMAGIEGGLRYAKSREMADLPRTRGFDEFMAKLEPGDLIFHRRPSRFSSDVKPVSAEFAKSLGDTVKYLPDINEAKSMIAAKGDTFYHPSIYAGNDKAIGAADAVNGVSFEDLTFPDNPEELLVMRAKDRELAKRALQYAKNAKGTPYSSYEDTIKHGLKHLAGITEEAGASCAPGTVCSEFVADAYPDLFPDRLMSPLDMRTHPDLDFVARYSHTSAPTIGEEVAAHGIYPLLKNLKWGALAGGAALGAGLLMHYANRNAEDDRNG